MDKREVALRQWLTALNLFLSDQDPVSVHSLAGNAQDVIERLCRRDGVAPFFDDIVKSHDNRTVRQLRNIVAAYRNAFKHARDDDTETLQRFSDYHNDHMLWIAAHDYGRLRGRMPVEMQAFEAWYFALHPGKLKEGLDPISFEQLFPNIQALDRPAQKNMLREQVAEGYQTPEIMEDPKTERHGLAAR